MKKGSIKIKIARVVILKLHFHRKESYKCFVLFRFEKDVGTGPDI